MTTMSQAKAAHLKFLANHAITPTNPLCCPQCGDAATLRTVDRLVSYAHARWISRNADGSPAVEGADETEIDWGTATTVGVSCGGCFWSYVGADWVDQLVAATTQDDD